MKIEINLFYWLYFTFFNTCSSLTDYQNLIAKIFENYDPGLRPVFNPKTVTNVTMRFGIIQLLDVEEVAQTVEVVSYMELKWHDEHLTWNASDFDNLTRFRYPHDKVWKPDIILNNTPDLNDGPVVNQASTNVVLNADGEIVNGFTAVYKATCRYLDMTPFPFDEHNCYLEFGSWTYSGNEVNIFNSGYGFELPNSMKQIDNTEWDLKVTYIEKIEEWECCPNETFPLLRIHISLKRRPLYYMINLVVPTIITCYVSFFGMFSPSSNRGERLEKAFLGITTLLAVSMVMLTVSSSMPVTSVAIPLMGWFLGIYIIIIAVAIICTSLIMHVDIQGMKGRPLPKWARKWILEWMGKFLGVTPNEYLSDPKSKEKAETPKKFTVDKLYLNNGLSKNSQEEIFMKIEFQLADINLTLKKLKHAKEVDKYLEYIQREWGDLCMVLDRLCLIFFNVFSTLFTIGLLVHH